jgi:cytoskeleton protein RodZ
MRTTEAGGEARCGIGTRLRAAREARGLTILQAAEKLHVDARVLESLEAEDFAALGAAVYARGHLRRYAELIGEAPAELQGLYPASANASGPDLTRVPHRAPERHSARLMTLALLVLLGFAIAGVLWWVLTLPVAKPRLVSATGTPGVGDSSASQLLAALANASGRSAPRSTASSAAEAQLDMRFFGVSWAQVTDASGRRLFEGLNAPDSTRTVSGTPPLRVIIGNAPGITLRLNGTRVALDELVRRDGSARFQLDGNGHVTPLPPLVAHGD